jgi:DNA-directed RNA polymerase specialized sigma24 family protein
MLKLPEKTVKSRLYEVRQLLRDRLLQREAI